MVVVEIFVLVVIFVSVGMFEVDCFMLLFICFKYLIVEWVIGLFICIIVIL